MTRYAVILGFITALFCIPACVKTIDVHDAGTVSTDAAGTQEARKKKEKSKELACDCCQKCKAAKGTSEPQEKQGTTDKNGCEDCCARCGEELQPRSQEAPPEVIEQGIRPELRDNK